MITLGIILWIFLGYISFCLAERITKIDGNGTLLVLHLIIGLLGFGVVLFLYLVLNVKLNEPSKLRKKIRGF